MMKEYLRDADRKTHEYDDANSISEHDFLVDCIDKAKSGNSEAGRELLSMAACRLSTGLDLGEELRDYIATVLLLVSQQPEHKAAKFLNIHKLPIAHRVTNNSRNRLLLAAYEAAYENYGFFNDQESLLLSQAIEKINSEQNEWEKRALLIDWIEEYCENKNNPLEKPDVEKLAAYIFNHRLLEDQKNGYRMKERQISATGIRSAIYRIQKS